jgi:hypothetical protein
MEVAMIHDVDETLKALIRRDVVNGSGVEISFEAPTREWAAKRTVPTVNCYLYDIREDLSRRDVYYEEIRDDAGMVTDRRQPPRRFKLSYLLTAWTQRPEDEHRLLSSLLGTFLKDDVLPEDLMPSALLETGKPVIVAVGLPPSEDRSISDVWSALGGELKPSLDLSVVAPFDPQRSMPAGPPVFEEPKIGVLGPSGEVEDIAAGRGGAGKGKEPIRVASGARSIGGKGGAAGKGGAGGKGGAAGKGGGAGADDDLGDDDVADGATGTGGAGGSGRAGGPGGPGGSGHGGASGGVGGAGGSAAGRGGGPGGANRAPSAVEVELQDLGVPTHSPEGKPLTLPMRMTMARKAREVRQREEAAAAAAQDETLASGEPEQPGRIFRIRGLPRT